MNHIDEFRPFEGDLQQFETKLIEIVVESGKYKFESEIEAHLMAYISLYHTFTQSLLKEISYKQYKKGKKKGISSGSISKYLNRFLDWRFIIKKPAKDKPNLLVYSLKEEITKLIFSRGEDLAIKLVVEALTFYSDKIHYLESIPFEPERNSIACIHLLKRLKELLEYIIEHSELLLKFSRNKKPKWDFSLPKPKEITQFDKTVEKIEQDLIEYTRKFRLFVFQNPSHSKIYAAFIIKKRLTQEELRKLTGLSTGVISEGLRYFLDHRLIKKYKTPRKRKKYYIMESIGLANFTRFHERLHTFTNFKPIVEEMIREIQDREEELKKLHGFTKIRDNLHSFKQLIPIYGLFENLIKEKIKKYQNQIIITRKDLFNTMLDNYQFNLPRKSNYL